MGRTRVRASVAKRRWLYLGGLLLGSLALILIWTSIAPALTVPTLDSQAWPTFAVGFDHSLAIRADGSLWAWGSNAYGQLGDGTTTSRSNPTRVGNDTDWVAVAPGHRFSLGLKSDGSLWAWGVNDHGQVGDGTTADRHVPTRVGTTSDWVAASAGEWHCLALKADGTLWAWGLNNDGQLGDGTSVDRHVPTPIGTETSWVAVSLASDSCYSLALRSDGSLWAWGDNVRGELGDGTTADRFVPTRIGTTSDWVAISAGEWHGLALKGDGSLWAWGWNNRGQLGDGTSTDRFVPTRIGSETDWVAVSAGNKHSLALKADGSLWAWGWNDRGQLGDGTTVDRYVSTRIGPAGEWVAASAGSELHCLALQADGSLRAWGGNGDGQLGDGTTADRSSPVQVLTGLRLPVTTTTSSTTTTTVPAAPTFPDVRPTHPYYLAISAMAGRGIIGGYQDGTFGPDKLVLRKHFAKMIVGAIGLSVTENDWQDANPPFTDCGSDDLGNLYPHDYIAVAKAHGLTSGKTATTFAPNANITRAQMVTMVVRAAQNSDISLKPVGADYAGIFAGYGDATHGDSVHIAEYSGLLEGLVTSGDASHWIAGTATRGEVAQVLWNLMQMPRD